MPVDNPNFFDPSPTVVADHGEERMWGDLSQRLSSFGNQLVSMEAQKRQGEKRNMLALYEAETAMDVLSYLPQLESRVFEQSKQAQGADIDLNPVEIFDSNFEANVKKWKENAPPEIAAQIELHARQKGAPVRARIAAKFEAEQTENARNSTLLGLEKLVDSASRSFANGEAEAAEADMEMFETIAQNGFASGLLGGKEDINTVQSAMRRARLATIIGEFEVALKSGDPVAYIQQFADSVPDGSQRDGTIWNNGMSADEHSEVWGKLETRLSRHLKHQEDADSAAEAARKERHEQGKRDVVLRLFEGEDVDLSAEVEADNIDPDWALQRRPDVAKRGPAYDDESTKAFYSLNLLDYEEMEIMEDDDLTYDTRAALVRERRAIIEDREDWRNDQNASEAARRIKNAVGLPDGIVVSGMSQSLMREANEALTEWYNEVQSLPAEERTRRATEIADRIVLRVDAKRAEEDLRSERARLAQAEDKLKDYPEGGAPHTGQMRMIERRKRNIADLQERINRGR